MLQARCCGDRRDPDGRRDDPDGRRGGRWCGRWCGRRGEHGNDPERALQQGTDLNSTSTSSSGQQETELPASSTELPVSTEPVGGTTIVLYVSVVVREAMNLIITCPNKVAASPVPIHSVVYS